MKKIMLSIALFTAALLVGCTADKENPEKEPEEQAEVVTDTAETPATVTEENLANEEVVEGAIDIDLEVFFPDREVRNIVKSMINKPAPNFVLDSLSGDKVEVASLQGKPFILEFAWSGCPACQAAQPNVVAFEKENPDIPVYQVFTDDTKEQLEQFIADTEATVAPHGESDTSKMLYRDQSSLTLHNNQRKSINELYNVQFVPTFYFVDSEGVIRFLTVGLLSDTELKALADLAFSKDAVYKK